MAISRRSGKVHHEEVSTSDTKHHDAETPERTRRHRRLIWLSSRPRWKEVPLTSSVLLLAFLACLCWIRVPQFNESEIAMSLLDGRIAGLALRGNDFATFPRCVQFVIDEDSEGKVHSRTKALNPNTEHFPSKREVFYPMSKPSRQERLLDSEDYDYYKAASTETDECKLKFEWQKTSKPNCNIMHELSFKDISNPDGKEHYRIVGAGFWRDVWVVHDEPGEKFVFKSMRYEHDFTERNFDRMRKDGNIMERLHSSKYVVDAYMFCGTSGYFEFADGGDISSLIWPRRSKTPKPNPLERLQIATQAAMGLAALHNVDIEGVATIAHTDIAPGQFLKINGRIKLNDFNRARFISFSQTNRSACAFEVGNNPGKNRAPEEYMYLPETEKIDIYSFGNVLYILLQEEWPFDDVKTSEAQKMIIKGKRPAIYEDVWNSTEPATVILKEAMIKCHHQNPKRRPSARKLENYLKTALEKLDPGRLKQWELEA